MCLMQTMDNKKEWQRAFESHVRQLDDKKPVVWGGDVNVAPTPKDLTNSKTNWNKTAGHTAIECDWYKKFLNPTDEANDKKFIDVWRKMHPDEQSFTYFSFLRKCREKGIGWRLDMCESFPPFFLYQWERPNMSRVVTVTVSERIYSRIKTCEIRSEIYGASDHVPLVLEIEGDL